MLSLVSFFFKSLGLDLHRVALIRLNRSGSYVGAGYGSVTGPGADCNPKISQVRPQPGIRQGAPEAASLRPYYTPVSSDVWSIQDALPKGGRGEACTCRADAAYVG